MKQTIDNISFEIKGDEDFSFLSKYGTVFCVFDQNDSGNISFGTDNGTDKYFIKVAGVKTKEASIDQMQAVENLKNAMPIYEALKHLTLIELLEHYERNDLYIAVFQWASGDCLYDHWNFEKYAKNPQLKSPLKRFKELPTKDRLDAVHHMFDFLAQVAPKGYVAVDFYDGSIMYDFDNNFTTICDIDLFRKTPAMNDIGEDFWGSKRLKAPEEYIYGAGLDESTNVYTLGALIFHFFSEYSNEDIGLMYQNKSFYPNKPEKWELNKALYNIALKAVNKDRNLRYQSILEFYTAWKNALSKA